MYIASANALSRCEKAGATISTIKTKTCFMLIVM
jgi:hypothetical protein